MWLESSVMAKCLSDEPGSSNASTRSVEAFHRHLNSTMRIHKTCLELKMAARGPLCNSQILTSEGRCATDTSEGRYATRTCKTHARHTHTSEGRYATHTCSHTCKTHAHKRGPLCNTQILTSEGRCLTEHTRTQSEGRCATHEYSQARAAMQHTHSQARAAATHSIDISALSILPGTPRAPRYIYSHSGPIYIASRGCCRGHVCFMRLGCCWGRFRFPFLYKNIRLFIKTYARVYVSAARAAIFLSKVRLLVPS